MNDQIASINYLAGQFFALEKEAELAAKRRDAVKWRLKQELFALYTAAGGQQSDIGITVSTKTTLVYDTPAMHAYLMREPVRNAGLLTIADFAYATAVGLLAANPVFAGSLELDKSALFNYAKDTFVKPMEGEFDPEKFEILAREANRPDFPIQGFTKVPDNIAVTKVARANIPAATVIDEALVKAAVKEAPKEKKSEGGDAVEA